MNIQKLIDTWRGPLVGLIAGWGVPWTEAGELAQDVLVEAYLGRDRFEGDVSNPTEVGPWLRGIARNVQRSQLRRSSRRREEPLVADIPIPQEGAEDDRLHALRKGIAALPERHRQVLCVYYLEECSLAEAAGILDISESTLEGRLYQARKELRRLLLPALQGGQSPDQQALGEGAGGTSEGLSRVRPDSNANKDRTPQRGTSEENQ